MYRFLLISIPISFIQLFQEQEDINQIEKSQILYLCIDSINYLILLLYRFLLISIIPLLFIQIFQEQEGINLIEIEHIIMLYSDLIHVFQEQKYINLTEIAQNCISF